MVDGATNTGRTLGRFTIAVIALSVVLHLWRLGLRPLAHDESIDAWFSWQARHWGVVPYDPVYHGPLRFYLVGPVLGFLGTSAFWVRIVAALAGIATTVMLARSTRTLGRVGAPLAALLFTISPTALTVTRTGREDSLVALVSMAMLLLVARLLTEPRRRAPPRGRRPAGRVARPEGDHVPVRAGRGPVPGGGRHRRRAPTRRRGPSRDADV